MANRVPKPPTIKSLNEEARARFDESRGGEIQRDLTAEEREAKAVEMAAAENRIAVLEEQIKRYKAQVKPLIDEARDTVARLAPELEYGRTWVQSQQQWGDIMGEAAEFADESGDAAEGLASAAADSPDDAADLPDDGELDNQVDSEGQEDIDDDSMPLDALSDAAPN